MLIPTDLDLVGVEDARVWASKWLRAFKEEYPEIPINEGPMILWFMFAIETGQALGRRKEKERDIVDRLREIVILAAEAATVPLREDNPNYIFPTERVMDAVDEICADYGLYPRE